MTQHDALSKILARINKPVTFLYPANEGHAHGTLDDRFVLPTQGRTGVPYWDVVDLIKFSDDHEPHIRIGYYRKPKDKLVWGSQTTITEPISTWRALLVGAARDKPWFRKLLSDVATDLESVT